MTLARAMVVMTPLTQARLGPRQDAIALGLAQAFPRGELVVSNDPILLRQRIAAFEPDVIIAAGGDGTVNLALRAMREHDALAVLPLGTANDLARFLGVRRNPLFIGSFVLDSACEIDCLKVNGQRFCTTGGLGLPAEVAHRVNVLRNLGRHRCLDRLGSHLYPAVAAQLCVRGPPRYRLEIAWEPLDGGDGERLELETHGLFVTNQATFARSLQVVDDADNADGVFELCIMLAHGRCELLQLLRHIVQRRPHPGELRTLRTRRATLRSDREVRFFGDGEVLCKASEFVIEIDELGLRLLR